MDNIRFWHGDLDTEEERTEDSTERSQSSTPKDRVTRSLRGERLERAVTRDVEEPLHDRRRPEVFA